MAFMNRDTVVEATIKAAEDELNEALNQERPDELGAKLPPKEGDKPAPEVPEVIDGHNWKERYANLQRLRQKNLDDHKTAVAALNADIQQLKDTVDKLTRKAAPASLPESEEDVEELRTNNPAAYNAITKLARSIADEIVADKMKDLSKDVDTIKQGHKKNAKEAAWIELQRRHPDLNLQELGNNDQFHVWLQSKSRTFQDAMYGDVMDVDSASDVLDAYKAAFKPTKKSTKTNAAEDITVKSAPSVPSKSAGWDFTESQIDEMSRKNPRWLEENIEAIDKAQRTGRILYDIADPIGSQRRMASEAA